MCGIVGRIDRQGAIVRTPHDLAAVRCLRHRGPDDEGTWYGARVFLGMRRLSVIDLAGGHQPMGNEDGRIQIVYNGEIYNFKDVRRELESFGRVFTTQSDTEVIVHGYEQWGEAVLDRLNGMFAIALWDGRDDTLLIARDRLGVKPLYYYADPRQLVFASEIKAILVQPGIARDVDSNGLLNYLAYGHAVGAETIYRGIRKLLPGHRLRLKGGEIDIRAWWNPVPGPATAMTERECAAEVRRLLEDSIRLRLISDVPLGAFLSGGLDSSAVVALMTRQMNRPVDTFSIGFDFGAEFNELPDARRVSAALRLQPSRNGRPRPRARRYAADAGLPLRRAVRRCGRVSDLPRVQAGAPACDRGADRRRRRRTVRRLPALLRGEMAAPAAHGHVWPRGAHALADRFGAATLPPRQETDRGGARTGRRGALRDGCCGSSRMTGCAGCSTPGSSRPRAPTMGWTLIAATSLKPGTPTR